MELGNSDKYCREVDEEGRLTLAMVVLREWWALGDSPKKCQARLPVAGMGQQGVKE